MQWDRGLTTDQGKKKCHRCFRVLGFQSEIKACYQWRYRIQSQPFPEHFVELSYLIKNLFVIINGLPILSSPMDLQLPSTVPTHPQTSLPLSTRTLKPLSHPLLVQILSPPTLLQPIQNQLRSVLPLSWSLKKDQTSAFTRYCWLFVLFLYLFDWIFGVVLLSFFRNCRRISENCALKI